MTHAVTAFNQEKLQQHPPKPTTVKPTQNTLNPPVLSLNYFQHTTEPCYPINMNYYHDKTTITKIQRLKAMRAAEMKRHTDAMKLVSTKYRSIIKDLEDLRHAEREVHNFVSHRPAMEEELGKKVTHKRVIVNNRLEKFLFENEDFLK